VVLPSIIEKRIRELNEKDDYDNERLNTRVDFISNNLILNETTQSMLDELSNRLMEIDNEDAESNEN
jgi:translation initiation factor 6 (eIF-6)